MTQAITALAVSFVLTLVIGKFLIPELRKLKARAVMACVIIVFLPFLRRSQLRRCSFLL